MDDLRKKVWKQFKEKMIRLLEMGYDFTTDYDYDHVHDQYVIRLRVTGHNFMSEEPVWAGHPDDLRDAFLDGRFTASSRTVTLLLPDNRTREISNFDAVQCLISYLRLADEEIEHLKARIEQSHLVNYFKE